ncbi:MAG: TorF family putative porin [Pseudomonadales bacterium]
MHAREGRFGRCIRHLLPAVFLIAAGTANAAWHGNLKWMSEYAYRGYSMSDGKPAIQGNLEYVAESGWYGGLSVSGEDLDSGAGNGTSSWVVIPRVGRQWRIDDDWQTETWIAAYRHEGKIEGKRANHAEITTAVHFRDLFTARLSFAPDAYGRSPDLLSVEFGAAYDLSPNLQTSGGIGYSASTGVSISNRVIGMPAHPGSSRRTVAGSCAIQTPSRSATTQRTKIPGVFTWRNSSTDSC